MEYLKKQTPFMQLLIFLGLFFTMLSVYQVAILQMFPMFSGGFDIIDVHKPEVFQNPAFIKGLKIAQSLYTLVIYLVPGLLFAYWFSESPRRNLKLDQNPKPSWILWGIALLLISLPLVGVSAQWNELWPLPESLRLMEKAAEEQTKVLLQMPDIASLLMSLVIMALIPAVAEEVFFRGVMQQIFSRMFKNGWIAAVVTAIIFSALHFQFLTFMPRVVLGSIMGIMFLLSGNLWVPIAAHFVNNGMQVVLIYLFNHGYIRYDVNKDENVPWYMALLSMALVFGLIWFKRASAKNEIDGTKLG